MSIGGPNLKLLHGLDEGQGGATRKNGGSVGADMDLNVWRSDAETILSVEPDGRGGKQVNFDYSDLATSFKALRVDALGEVGDTPDSVPYAPDLATIFATDSGLGVTLGGRFEVGEIPSGVFDALIHGFCNHNDVTPAFPFGVGIKGDAGGTGGIGQLVIWAPNVSTSNSGYIADGVGVCTLDGDSPDTPADADGYIADGKTYTYIVRIVNDAANGSGNTSIYVWLRNETDGEEYRWTFYQGDTDWSSWRTALQTYLNYAIGCGPEGPGGGGFLQAFPGWIDQVWFYEGVISDSDAGEILVSGLTIPWSEPDYRVADHVVYSSVTKENADHPKPRILPEGATVARHPVGVLCQEVRVRLEGWRPGRPWLLKDVRLILDPAGPYGSHRARQSGLRDLTSGVNRRPGTKVDGAAEDARNVVWTHLGPRRRRGYKVRRDVSSESTNAANAFFTWRDYDDQLHWLYKVGTKLYVDDGSQAAESDTGWSSSDMPVGFSMDGRLILLSNNKRRVSRGVVGAIDPFGTSPPSSISPATSVGGTLDDSYYYAVTAYDPDTGDETGPKVSAQVSPSNEKVTLTLPAAAPETRFTKYRIYRTNAGGAPPNLFFMEEINVATTWDDTGLDDGTELVDQVIDSSGTFLGYITMEMPDTFTAGCVHLNRAVYAGGATNPQRVYITEPSEPLRLYTSSWFDADGPVRAVVSWQRRLLVFTDNTVEIVDSDFVRDADANYSLSRFVVTRDVGCAGPNAVVAWQGNVWWLDRRGVYTIQGTEVVPISEDIYDLFPYMNHNLLGRCVGGFNHLARSLWWTVPCSALQDNSERFQTQLVTDLFKPARWAFHSLDATFVGQFDDDLNGIRFGAMDAAGVFKELESYEGNGAEGDEAFTTEDEGDDLATPASGIASISGNVITVHGTPGWTSDALRGVQVVLRDRSTGVLYEYLVVANAAGTFTVDRTPNANLADGDGYYLGGMAAFAAFAGYDFNTPNRKNVQQVQYELADLTMEELYL